MNKISKKKNIFILHKTIFSFIKKEKIIKIFNFN